MRQLQLAQALPEPRLGETDEAAYIRRLVARRGIHDACGNRGTLEFFEYAHQLARLYVFEDVIVIEPPETRALYTGENARIDLIGDKSVLDGHLHLLASLAETPMPG